MTAIAALPPRDADGFLLDRADWNEQVATALARGLHETGDLLGGFLLHAQQHQKGAGLQRVDLAVEDHPERRACLLAFERARATASAPERAHEGREGMFLGAR